MATDDLLIVADGAHCADLRYAVGAPLTRPAVYLRLHGRGYALLDEADLPAGRAAARDCRVRPLSRYLPQGNGQPTARLAAAISRWLRTQGVRRVVVPADFPLALARELRDHKLRLLPRPDGPLFPERAVKSAAEVAMIRAAVVMAEVGLAEGLQTLKNAQINSRRRLVFRGAPLTAERLRAIMQVAIFQAGGHPEEVTVTLGMEGGCPGPSAHGPLPAHRPLLLALLLRSCKTGYHAALVRTVVRGRAREPVRARHAAHLQTQSLALRHLREGVETAEAHAALLRSLTAHEATPTRPRRASADWQAHVSGHGVGLARWEPPFLPGPAGTVLQTGHVLTVVSGATHPRWGSVALADMVVITRHGARNLTPFEKVLEI
jgi:Xaa-Pro aminopeptidase